MSASGSDALPLGTFGSEGAASKARLAGSTVVRDGGPWSGTVIALLHHFERVGFAGAPQVVGSGIDAQGREIVRYLPGMSPHPRAWSDAAVHRVGEVLRAAHDAARSFVPPIPPRWQPWFGRGLPGDDPVIGHCDVGPWNWIARSDGLPYALVDWEFAGPVDAMWEVAHAAWLNAQLHDDDVAELHSLPEARSRARQARLLMDGYGLTQVQRDGMFDRMVHLAVYSARAEAVDYQVSASTPAGRDPQGFPVLWAVTWRVRSAAWMLRNRTLVENTIRER